MIFFAVGRMPIVEANIKAIQILLATRGDVGNKLLRSHARFFCGDHNRRAMRIVGAYKMNFISAHAHKAHPDIGLNVFHDVTNMECTVGIGQGGGNEQRAGMGIWQDGAHGGRLEDRNKSRILSVQPYYRACR